MELVQIDATGCRIVGAITKGLEHLGPKHHAIVLGKNIKDGLIYIAEHMHTGYQVVTYNSFTERYASNGTIYVHKNDGHYDGLAAANKALNEIKAGGKGVYNLITNNCECFVNRAIHDKSFSQQVINTSLGVAGLLIIAGLGYYAIKNSR